MKSNSRVISDFGCIAFAFVASRLDYYLSRVTWQDEDHVLVTWLNRPQNKSVTMHCDVTMGECQLVSHVQTCRAAVLILSNGSVK